MAAPFLSQIRVSPTRGAASSNFNYDLRRRPRTDPLSAVRGIHSRLRVMGRRGPAHGGVPRRGADLRLRAGPSLGLRWLSVIPWGSKRNTAEGGCSASGMGEPVEVSGARGLQDSVGSRDARQQSPHWPSRRPRAGSEGDVAVVPRQGSAIALQQAAEAMSGLDDRCRRVPSGRCGSGSSTPRSGCLACRAATDSSSRRSRAASTASSGSLERSRGVGLREVTARRGGDRWRSSCEAARRRAARERS